MATTYFEHHGRKLPAQHLGLWFWMLTVFAFAFLGLCVYGLMIAPRF